MSPFKVGDLCVCVNAKFGRWLLDYECANGISANVPWEGGIFTIRELVPDWHFLEGQNVGVRLAEISNPPVLWTCGVRDELAFGAPRFRPLTKASVSTVERLKRSMKRAIKNPASVDA